MGLLPVLIQSYIGEMTLPPDHRLKPHINSGFFMLKLLLLYATDVSSQIPRNSILQQQIANA